MLYSLLNTMENLNIKSLEFVPNKPYQSVNVLSLFQASWEHVTAPLIGPKHELIMLGHLSLVQYQEKQEVTLLFVQTDICVTMPLIGSDQELYLILLLVRTTATCRFYWLGTKKRQH